MQACLSIHDVMPHTLERVEHILACLQERCVPPVTLLVVPGLPWEPPQIQRLRELAAEGHELAAHGWQHETTPRRLYHRLHAALISRKVAEHLDLDSQGILELMQRSKNWFAENDLPLPQFYVPPAWALGPITQADLTKAPYRLIETTRGLIHLQAPPPAEQKAPPAPSQAGFKTGPIRHRPDDESRAVSFQKLPLTGYEADTAFRKCFLRSWNAYQAKAAVRSNCPLRISIHPDDLELRLADQLEQQIKAIETFRRYQQIGPHGPVR